MPAFESITTVYHRASEVIGPELTQSVIRLAIVGCAMVYFHSAFFAGQVADLDRLAWAHGAVNSAFALTVAIAGWILVRPAPSPVRRGVGMLHDIGAISVAMYLGQAASAPIAAIYLWVTLGNGFRYGNGYMYACAMLSVIGFGTVYLTSEYWRQQSSLSINILVLLAVIPPYVAALLSSLHKARAELRHRATFDALTGLLNRAEFEREAEKRLRRVGSGHVMLFCDLDFFKEVNDRAGHAAGDKLLQDVGAIIREQVRSTDLCGRPGGDEFCVLLDNCPLERGRRIAESIRNAVAGYRLAWGRECYSVGISIGVAGSGAVKDLGSLLRLADAATYAAKNSGRNQIHVIDPRLDGANTQRLRKLYAGESSPSARNRRVLSDR